MRIRKSAIALLPLLALLMLPLGAQAGHGGIHGNEICPDYLEKTNEKSPNLENLRWIHVGSIRTENFVYELYEDIAQPNLEIAAVSAHFEKDGPAFVVTWQLGETEGKIHSVHTLNPGATCSRNVMLPNGEYKDLTEFAVRLRKGLHEKN